MIMKNAVICLTDKIGQVFKTLIVEANDYDKVLKILDKLDKSKLNDNEIDNHLYELFNKENIEIEIPYILGIVKV